MKEKMRTFKKLCDEKNLQELNDFAKSVTEAYALSSLECSQRVLAADNNLTIRGLRDLIDYAIVSNLVDRSMAQKVLEKRIHNQQKKVKNAGGSSVLHYKKIINLREKNLAEWYPICIIGKIAKDFAEIDEPIKYFTEKYKIESDSLTRKLLERAIAENIASDKEMEAIFKRSLKVKDNERIRNYFNYILQKREIFKKENSQ